MAIEIVDLPIENGDFPQLCKRLPEGTLVKKKALLLCQTQVMPTC
jgi:hypothetical protein